MKKTLRSTTIALGLVALAACSAKTEKPSLTGDMDLSGLASDASLTPENKAEKFAQAAEQLAQSSSFALAEPVLEQALSLDPSNKRAQLYKAVLAQKFALRGSLVRIKPLVRKNPESVAKYNKVLSDLPNGALRDFLMDGQEDIKTEKDAQAFLDQMHEGREELRNFLKSNKDLSISVRLNDVISAAASKDATMKECTYKQPRENVYDYTCELVTVTEVKLNRADVESLQQIVAGMQVYSTLLNSYDVTGAIETAKKPGAKYANSAQIIAELSKYSDFGKLRNQNLTKLAEMGMDAIAGVRWAAELQKELCPKGEDAKDQRKGHLFKDGICITQESENGESLESVLQQIELALSGNVMQMEVNGITTDVKPAAPILNPIEDVKALGLKVDKCGTLVGISDVTAGGLLPKGNAVEILAANNQVPCQQ